jgi:N-acetylglutamate synthase-like GNAT family acetyltransferase
LPFNYLIRDALESDAEGIISAHQNAVHVSAKLSYEQAILDEWSPILSSRVLQMQEKLQNNPEGAIILVVESEGRIAGFGEIVPSQKELRAIYIDPQFSRMGFGRALLQELESRAKKQGLAKLTLHASLNATDFYSQNGFKIDGEGNHKLSSGRLMPCIFMSKNLD